MHKPQLKDCCWVLRWLTVKNFSVLELSFMQQLCPGISNCHRAYGACKHPLFLTKAAMCTVVHAQPLRTQYRSTPQAQQQCLGRKEHPAADTELAGLPVLPEAS